MNRTINQYLKIEFRAKGQVNFNSDRHCQVVTLHVWWEPPETRVKTVFYFQLERPREAAHLFMKLICQCLSHLHACVHTHTIINPLKMYWQQLTKWGTCQKSLTAKSYECRNRVSSLMPHILRCGLAVFTTCCGPNHWATLPYFSFVTKGQFMTLPLPSSSETQARHFFSPWFPHKCSQSEMSGQADRGCISEKDRARWNLDLFNFLLPWGWVREWQSCTVYSAATSHTGFLYLKKKKVKRLRRFSSFSSVYPTHTLLQPPAGAPFLFALTKWEAMWRFRVCFVTNCNHFLFLPLTTNIEPSQ